MALCTAHRWPSTGSHSVPRWSEDQRAESAVRCSGPKLLIRARAGELLDVPYVAGAALLDHERQSRPLGCSTVKREEVGHSSWQQAICRTGKGQRRGGMLTEVSRLGGDVSMRYLVRTGLPPARRAAASLTAPQRSRGAEGYDRLPHYDRGVRNTRLARVTAVFTRSLLRLRRPRSLQSSVRGRCIRQSAVRDGEARAEWWHVRSEARPIGGRGLALPRIRRRRRPAG